MAVAAAPGEFLPSRPDPSEPGRTAVARGAAHCETNGVSAGRGRAATPWPRGPPQPSPRSPLLRARRPRPRRWRRSRRPCLVSCCFCVSVGPARPGAPLAGRPSPALRPARRPSVARRFAVPRRVPHHSQAAGTPSPLLPPTPAGGPAAAPLPASRAYLPPRRPCLPRTPPGSPLPPLGPARRALRPGCPVPPRRPRTSPPAPHLPVGPASRRLGPGCPVPARRPRTSPGARASLLGPPAEESAGPPEPPGSPGLLSGPCRSRSGPGSAPVPSLSTGP